MVLDNAKIHHSKILQPFLQEHEEQLTLVFLPPYSPNLNLVERIWGWLKESVIANRFHPTRKELRESIVSFLEYLSEFPERVLQRIGQVVMSGTYTYCRSPKYTKNLRLSHKGMTSQYIVHRSNIMSYILCCGSDSGLLRQPRII
jgi:hypothetical protein